MNILDFIKKKTSREKISMITCYDYTSAKILAQTNIDCLLVGDSVAMTMHGFTDTLSATIEMMCTHTSAVKRGASNKFIVADMPFLSYRKSLSEGVTAAGMLMQAGAHAVKLESATGNLELIRHLTESGIPVMGHLGLTPQFVNSLGGYKVQATTQESAEKLKLDARKLQDAGCFALVLECVPARIAAEVTNLLDIPSIGIGAGADTDGQVLVFQDLLGLNLDFQPKFVKTYLNGSEQIIKSVEAYIQSINSGEFPRDEHSFHAA
jgi:3-methyl-2-oxobutanoate hydroxymethyltransferase